MLAVNGVFQVACLVVGVALTVIVVDSAVRSVVLPRGVAVAYTRLVFTAMRSLFMLRTRYVREYEKTDRIMALYGPLTIVTLPATWIAVLLFAFTFIFRGLGIDGWKEAFETSGSSLFTLGFLKPPDLPTMTLSFIEAALGLGLLALLISFLPSLYGTFSRREVPVAQLEVYAGNPPSAVTMLVRAHRISSLDALDDVWRTWDTWFAELGETHTSFASLVFWRSPKPDRSWVTAAGAVLDAASFAQSTLAVGYSQQAALAIRAGYLALRDIATFFDVRVDHDPAPDDPISITRDEYFEAYETMAAAGVPVRADRERCWRDFAGWRVNYDAALLALAGITLAPYAPWSSDRSLRYRRPRLLPRGRPPR